MTTIYDRLMAKAAEWRKMAEFASESPMRKLWLGRADELEALAKQVCAEAQDKLTAVITGSLDLRRDIIGGPPASVSK